MTARAALGEDDRHGDRAGAAVFTALRPPVVTIRWFIGSSDVMLLADRWVGAIFMNEVGRTGGRLDAASVLVEHQDDRC